MALISSVAFDLKGQEVATFVLNQYKPSIEIGEYGTTYTLGYVQDGPKPLFGAFGSTQADAFPTGIRSASTAYGKGGAILQDLVTNTGVATQYITYPNGVFSKIALGSGVESISVAFEPDSTGISDVVYEDGSYYEFTPDGGSTLVASNVVSASVAIDKSGNKLQDYVTADGVLHEISSPAPANPGDPAPTPTTTTLGTEVVSSGVAFDGNGGVVRAVVFSDGTAYQYDYAGAHQAPGTLFPVVLQHVLGSVSLAFDRSLAGMTIVSTEHAAITFPGGTYGGTALQSISYEYTPTGSQVQGLSERTYSIAFAPGSIEAMNYVDLNGDAVQVVFNPNSHSTFTPPGDSTKLGTNVQSYQLAYYPDQDAHQQYESVADVVYMNGEYYEFDPAGNPTLIATNVVSASVAMDLSGNKLQDYVTADGVAHEISTPAATKDDPNPTPTTTTLGTNVVSIGVAFDGNGGIVRSVLFTNGLAYQYDYSGQHLQGQVFDPSLDNPNRLALKARLFSY